MNSFSKWTKLTSSLLVVGLSQMSFAQDYVAPKTSFGVPDLQGTYSIATVTMLERGAEFNGQLTITAEEAERIGTTGESYLSDLTSRGAGGEPDVGGYNTFWMDPGERMAVINGEIRTSILVQPQNGRLPWAEGAQRAIFANRNKGRGPYDGPEARPLGERCLVGFGSSGGPPMLPVLYNNHSQIVQTPNYVMIVAEMNHDARIIRLRDSEHSDIPKWLGDSIGYYEGDTLVVETTNYHTQQSLRGSLRHFFYLSPDAKVTERFTRTSDSTLLYQFTVDDPKVYSTPWVGELPMNAVEDKIYEYACHEGNYALPGILAGARIEEKDSQ
ncbi:MAG: hypothetical protein COA96_03750 [SAR86 cluster bacterium]|uniref:Uncharacterized protein n=1 Tax=SAR86 cluster bacterium TaxID=2030880 RepID=A0A2A5B7H6_9GAMM|nr:MAG: hypothetical protein COA96_03750 [SAR86 cluster bacterium]